MSADPQTARRYLLRETSEEESLEIEREYFADQRVQEAIATAEDTLIEDYLDGALAGDERTRFERTYLASAGHRRRVDTIRRLQQAASTRGTAPSVDQVAIKERRSGRITSGRALALALAATVVLAAGVATWMRSGSHRESTPPVSSAGHDASAPRATEAAPRVFAFTVPRMTLRGAADEAALVIPPDTAIVRLEIGIDAAARDITRGAIRSVEGNDVWDGPVRVTTGAPAGTVASLDVPAARLRPDDYIITVTTAERVEAGRYALHVRAR